MRGWRWGTRDKEEEGHGDIRVCSSPLDKDDRRPHVNHMHRSFASVYSGTTRTRLRIVKPV